MMQAQSLTWLGIVRLGLVQTALGAIVVLTTSTINRVMIVELALPAMLPGALVAWHYAVQLSRPRWGYGSDTGGRRTPWIIGGIIVLATGGVLASVATALMAQSTAFGIGLAIIAFTLVGAGVGASGTSLLALLATTVDPERRAAAATIVWMMMIFGFIITTITVGNVLDPFTTSRLVVITAVVSVIAVIVATLSVAGIESRLVPKRSAANAPLDRASGQQKKQQSFSVALEEIWGETEARRFTIFVFVSMLAYSVQDIILEPFAGLIFGMTPGETTKLSGTQHAGVFLGMAIAALAGSRFAGFKFGSLLHWTIGGCIATAIALVALSMSAHYALWWPLELNVFILGLTCGAFAVAAIGSMMRLAGRGRKDREGLRMGLWGAAQAIAFGIGGFAGAAAVDSLKLVFADIATVYSVVFLAEAALFIVSAALASWVSRAAHDRAVEHNQPVIILRAVESQRS